MHDSILPHLAQPTLMIDFLTSACDVGEWDFHLGYLAGTLTVHGSSCHLLPDRPELNSMALGSHPLGWPPAAMPIPPLPAQAQGEQGIASCLPVFLQVVPSASWP